MTITTIKSGTAVNPMVQERIAEFLHEHLDQYGDDLVSINQAIDYSQSTDVGRGGFISYAEIDDKIVGAVVCNHTGMGGYIPENILVYIATHGDYRGKGIGKALMKELLDQAEGDIALHVEHNNPAIKLYEKLGFTNPYLEMRLKR